MSAHALTTVYLTALVGRTIVQSYFALPPSQNTRHRQPARNRHVKTFVALAGASFSFATFHAYTFSSLSYRIWAAERGVEGSPQITRWLNDTPIYRDALEIVAEKACHFWWSQQLNLSAQSWGILVAIEGQRRNIPHRWAFLMLAQLVSLSFAQNLWYVAMLLSPVPLPDNVGDLTGTYVPATISKFSQLKKKIMLSKPAEWKPHPLLYIFPLLWSLCTTFLIPIASNTPSFMTITLLSKSLTFTPILLPYIVPVSWGKVHAHPHESFGLYTSLFKSISVASGLLHGKESLRALLYNTPDSYYHRHILLYPFKTEYCSLFKRSTTAVGRVFGAVGDHPAVAAVRWDVLISSLSLGVWSAVQGLQVHKILANNIPFYQHAEKVVGNIGEEIKSEVKDIGSSALRVYVQHRKFGSCHIY